MEDKIALVEKRIETQDKVSVFKKRMLVWDSPVEYVNNMYGCHPNDFRMEYFDIIYEKDGEYK